MNRQFPHLHLRAFPTRLTALGTAILLAACGGGSPAPGTAEQQPSRDSVPVKTATLGECFKWTPGTKYSMSDGSKQLIVQEAFEGQTVTGWMELRANDTRFGGAYVAVDNTYVRLLGGVDYDDKGVLSSKEVFSADARFPVDMAAGQTVRLSYVETKTDLRPAPATTTTTITGQITFVGVEALTLGGRTFTDVCKIRVESSEGGTTFRSMVWVAKGFGNIRTEQLDAQGAAVPGTREELTAIISAP